MPKIKALTPDVLHKFRMDHLKEECHKHSLHISGTKPVLIGRILAFQQIGDAKEVNKKTQQELKEIYNENPSSADMNKSKYTKKMEKAKTKTCFQQCVVNSKKRYHELNELVFGMSSLKEMLDFECARLNKEYDTQTMDEFIEYEIKPTHKTLKSLNLPYHKYCKKELFERVQFPELEVLRISDNMKLTDEDLEAAFSACPKLKAIDLMYSFVEGDSFKNVFQKCPDLSFVQVPRGRLSDLKKMLHHLQPCQITTIEGVEAYKIDDETIELLVSMPLLRKCTITYKDNGDISKKGLDLLKNKYYKLVNFPFCTILQNCATTTDLACGGKIEREEFESFLNKCPHLISVDLRELEGTNIDEIIVALANSPQARSIETMDLTMRKDITNIGVKALGKMTSLQSLELSFAWDGMYNFDPNNIDQDVFVEASKSWKQLHTLKIMWAPIGIERLQKVLNNCPSLSLLDITGCGGDAECNDFTTFHLFQLYEDSIRRRGLSIKHERR